MVKTVKEEDIVTDVLNTVRSLAEKKGQQLSEEVMGQAEQLIRAKWWGDRPYIKAKSDTAGRDQKIYQDAQNGVPAVRIAMRNNLSPSRTRKIIKRQRDLARTAVRH